MIGWILLYLLIGILFSTGYSKLIDDDDIFILGIIAIVWIVLLPVVIILVPLELLF